MFSLKKNITFCARFTRVVLWSSFLHRTQVATAAEEYGYHMGLAFQIVDDILDIVGAADVSLSSPGGETATTTCLVVAVLSPRLPCYINRYYTVALA